MVQKRVQDFLEAAADERLRAGTVAVAAVEDADRALPECRPHQPRLLKAP